MTEHTPSTADQMRAALEQTIALLEPWARTGRPKKANR